MAVYRKINRCCFAAFIRLFSRPKPNLFACAFYFRCDSQYAGGAVVAHVVAYLHKKEQLIQMICSFLLLSPVRPSTRLVAVWPSPPFLANFKLEF